MINSIHTTRQSFKKVTYLFNKKKLYLVDFFNQTTISFIRGAFGQLKVSF